MSAVPSHIRQTEPSDLDAVVDLLNACDVVETGSPDTTAQDVENDWALEDFDLSHDTWVAVADDGCLAGYAYTGDQLSAGELEADFWIHPEHHESRLAERLLNLAERRARRLRPRARQPQPTSRSGRSGRAKDESVMYSTMTDAYGDHDRSGKPPIEAWRTKPLDHGDFDLGDLGWIKGLGVRWPWRSRGIGGALLARAFAELARRDQRRVELGVETEAPALRVYERAGMHVAFSYDSYVKHLAGPGVSSP